MGALGYPEQISAGWNSGNDIDGELMLLTEVDPNGVRLGLDRRGGAVELPELTGESVDRPIEVQFGDVDRPLSQIYSLRNFLGKDVDDIQIINGPIGSESRIGTALERSVL